MLYIWFSPHGSNRDGIGAIVRVASAGGRQWQMVRSGSSYASQSELTLTFGLAYPVAPPGEGCEDVCVEAAVC